MSIKLYMLNWIKNSSKNPETSSRDYNAKINTVPSRYNGNDTVSNNIIELPDFDFSNYTNLNSFFNNCKQLTKIGNITNTSQVTSFFALFNNCERLKEIPIMDVSSVTTMQMMCFHCYQLNNIGLNNILYMCSQVSSNYTAKKTLANIGLDSTQAQICTTLSNWADCQTAGWSTGY